MTPVQYKRFKILVEKKLSRKLLKINILENTEEFEKMVIYFTTRIEGKDLMFYGIRTLSADNSPLRKTDNTHTKRLLHLVKTFIESKYIGNPEKSRIEIIEYIVRCIMCGFLKSKTSSENYLFDLQYMKSKYYRDLCDYYDRMKSL